MTPEFPAGPRNAHFRPSIITPGHDWSYQQASRRQRKVVRGRCFTNLLDMHSGVLIEFSGHPQSDCPTFDAPSNHITTPVEGSSLFLMKPVKMQPIGFLDFATELFLSSAFADEPFPDLLLAKSFADQLESPFYRVVLRRMP